MDMVLNQNLDVSSVAILLTSACSFFFFSRPLLQN